MSLPSALTRSCLMALLLGAIALLTSCEEARRQRERETSAPLVAERGEPDARGMCTLHDVPFDVCTRCNPALVPVFKAKGDWCEEHDFPLSFCPIHNPGAVVPGQAPAAKEAATTPDPSPSQAVGAPEGAREQEGGELARPSAGEIEGRVVRFASPSLEEDVGITTVEARRAEIAPEVACAAHLTFDADRVADVRALVPGIVREVRVEVGQRVEKEDTLFVLESQRVGTMQSELQNARERTRVARSNLERKQQLRDEKITSARAVELAQEELARAQATERAAKSSLRISGAPRGAASGRYSLKAPIAGQVIHRPAVTGALAAAEVSLATIVDTSTMWVMCDVPEQSAHLVASGQILSFETPGAGKFGGVIGWISPEVDPRTRAVRVRAEIANPQGLLRANQFANATIYTGAPRESVLVPRDAIQRIEGHEVIFVRASAGTYLPRVIERFGGGKEVSVRGKIKPGEAVVTQGAVLLRTEAMPGSIGAGCCEVEPGGEE